MEIRNAKITSTMLGFEDHGIFTCMIQTLSDGVGQGFGGYGLGGEWGCQFIKKVLSTVGVETWEELEGKYIRLEATHTKVIRIGHITENKWFDPEKDLEKFKSTAGK